MSMEYQAGGSLPPDAWSYVKRQADDELFVSLRAGEFCYVLNSRQMGKSSLRTQMQRRLQAEGTACAVVDLQEIGKQMETAEQWYAGVVQCLVSGFELTETVKWRSWWRERKLLSPVQRLGEFIREVLLPALPDRQLVILVDEIDSVLGLEFPLDDFFALIRSCHKRADRPEYQRLSFALFGVATPANLIQDKTRTPFNIGKAIALEGFRFEEARGLASGLAERAANPKAVLREMLYWTRGQPFLTQKLCQIVQCMIGEEIPVGEEITWVEQLVQARLIDNWEAQDEPEHLRTIRNRLFRQEERTIGRLLGLYQEILQQGSIKADSGSDAQTELRLSGLVVNRNGQLEAYNPIYRNVFNLNWVQQELAKLRDPFYAESLNAWILSKRQDESVLLRGQALQDALTWGSVRKLSDEDYQFLAASQELEKQTVQRALVAEKEANQILAEAHQELEKQIVQRRLVDEKANQILAEAHHRAVKRIRMGSVVLIASLIGALVAGGMAWKANKDWSIADRSLTDANTSLTQAKNEKTILEDEKNKLQGERNKLTQEKQNLANQVQQFQQQLQILSQEKVEAQTQANATKETQRQAEAASQEAERKFQEANQELDTVRQSLEDAGAEKTIAEQKVIEAQRRLSETHAEVERTQVDLEGARQELQAAIDDLQNVEDELASARQERNLACKLLLEKIPIQGNSELQELILINPNGSEERLDDLCIESIEETASAEPYSRVLEYYQRALAVQQEIGSFTGQGIAINRIGAAYASLGQYPQALEYYQRALQISKQQGNRNEEGVNLSNIGALYANLGRYPEALEYYQQALVIQREIHDRAGEGTTLHNSGATYANLGRYPEALEQSQQALVIQREIHDRAGEGKTLGSIGSIYANLGRYRDALEYYWQASAIQQKIGDRAGAGRTLSNIGATYTNLEQYDQALVHYQQALAIQQEIGDRLGEGITFSNIGATYTNLEQYDQALNYHQQALAIQQEIGNRLGEGITFNNIGATYTDLEQYDQALVYYQQALAIQQEIGDVQGEASTLNDLGIAYAALQLYKQAIEYYEKALAIAREIGNQAIERTVIANLSNARTLMPNLTEPIEAEQQNSSPQRLGGWGRPIPPPRGRGGSR